MQASRNPDFVRKIAWESCRGKTVRTYARGERIVEGSAGPGSHPSVGDHYTNDIAPAMQAGWITVHISPRQYFPGASTFRGTKFDAVIPYLAD